MLALAFGPKHHCTQVQPHRAAGMTVELSCCMNVQGSCSLILNVAKYHHVWNMLCSQSPYRNCAVDSDAFLCSFTVMLTMWLNWISRQLECCSAHSWLMPPVLHSNSSVSQMWTAETIFAKRQRSSSVSCYDTRHWTPRTTSTVKNTIRGCTAEGLKFFSPSQWSVIDMRYTHILTRDLKSMYSLEIIGKYSTESQSKRFQSGHIALIWVFG